MSSIWAFLWCLSITSKCIQVYLQLSDTPIRWNSAVGSCSVFYMDSLNNLQHVYLLLQMEMKLLDIYICFVFLIFHVCSYKHCAASLCASSHTYSSSVFACINSNSVSAKCSICLWWFDSLTGRQHKPPLSHLRNRSCIVVKLFLCDGMCCWEKHTQLFSPQVVKVMAANSLRCLDEDLWFINVTKIFSVILTADRKKSAFVSSSVHSVSVI